jgi:alkylated DNA nucleotide flippase Atl1
VTTPREDVIIRRIRAIPKGFVSTYGDIEPGAPRMVGRVLATTREEVPWQRVVRSDGSAAKGRRQLELLRREGVPLHGERVDLRLARYHGIHTRRE